MPIIIICSKGSADIPGQQSKIRKEKLKTQNQKDINKTTYFSDVMIVYIEIQKAFTEKLLVIIRELSNAAVCCKINIHNQLYFYITA